MTLRLFLDANVSFSAAYRRDSALRKLWSARNVQLITSAYALEESRRNLDTADQLADLEHLSNQLVFAPQATTKNAARQTHGVADKDKPILWAAIDAKADYLLTGDKQHFGHIIGQVVEGTRVVTPRMFIDAHPTLVQDES